MEEKASQVGMQEQHLSGKVHIFIHELLCKLLQGRKQGGGEQVSLPPKNLPPVGKDYAFLFEFVLEYYYI